LFVLPLFAVAVLLLLSSCENSFLAPEELAKAQMIESSLRSGGLISGQEEIRFSLDAYDADVPLGSLELELQDSRRRTLKDYLLEDPLAGFTVPVQDLQSLEDGLYFVEARLLDENEELLEERQIPFFLSDRRPVIERLETYPPSALRPGADGIIIPRLSMVEDAWVRWTQDGRFLEEGSLQSYREGFVWTASRNEGVYSIGFEVFPYSPAELGLESFDFESSVYEDVQFYIKRGGAGLPFELQPAGSYLHLLHLRGSTEDEGTSPANFELKGEAEPTVYGDLFGYLFRGRGAIEAPVGLVPAEDRLDKPFTLTFVGRLASPSASKDTAKEDENSSSVSSAGQVSGRRRIVEVDGAEGTRYLSLSYDRSGSAYFQMAGMEKEQKVSGLGLFGLRELSLSFIPHSGGSGVETATVKWYVDGALRVSETVVYSPAARPEAAVTIIGGPEGFAGIIDEFGIYYRDEQGMASADTDIYARNAIRSRGRETVYFADGYENGRGAEDGLRIAPGETRRLVDLETEWEELELIFKGSPGSGAAELLLRDDEGELLRSPLALPGSGKEKPLLVRRREGRVSLATGESRELISRRESSGTVEVHIHSPEEAAGSLRLDQLLIIRSAAGLVAESN